MQAAGKITNWYVYWFSSVYFSCCYKPNLGVISWKQFVDAWINAFLEHFKTDFWHTMHYALLNAFNWHCSMILPCLTFSKSIKTFTYFKNTESIKTYSWILKTQNARTDVRLSNSISIRNWKVRIQQFRNQIEWKSLIINWNIKNEIHVNVYWWDLRSYFFPVSHFLTIS